MTKKAEQPAASLAANPVLAFPGDGKKAPAVTVRMTRDQVYGEPTEADVHPDEVANWQEHNWVIEG
jgi:hypothetical protein